MTCLSINSLLAHIDELRIFMEMNYIHVRKLDSDIRNDEISIPGFNVIRKDRHVNGRNEGVFAFTYVIISTVKFVRTYVQTHLSC